MKNSKEYDDLLSKKQEILQTQDMYMAERSNAKKHFREIDFSQDDKVLEQMCQSIYEDGAQGDKKLLNLLVEARDLMSKQEMGIKQLEEEMDLEMLFHLKEGSKELSII